MHQSCWNLFTTTRFDLAIHSRRSFIRSYHSAPKTLPKAPYLGLGYLRRTGMAEQSPRAPSPPQTLHVSAKPPAKALSKRQKKRHQHNSLPEPCSSEDVLWHEINDVLGEDCVKSALADGTDMQSPFAYHQELEMQVVALCSTGSALATSAEANRPWVVVVPFALPGETIRVKIYKNARMHSLADLLEIVTPNHEFRDSSRVQCKYFGSCGGCQYQMLSYEKQLDLKRDVVVKAYKNFSELSESAIPTIESTMPSPKQYEYRTKITPHFEAPTKSQRHDPTNPKNDTERPEWFTIGFNRVGTHKVMDIEDCPIATPIIRETLPAVRANAIKNLYTYKRGVSLILRDSLPPASTPPTDAVGSLSADLEKHVCITDHRGSVREKVGTLLFEYPNGSFFQNNNSVLPSLTSYVQACIFAASGPRPTHLVDAYCGAGLFAIALAPHFTTLNGLPASQVSFRAGDAADIFRTVGGFPARETVLLIDPPRKGCDAPFVAQLLAFRARTVVYVSCNVHTQARDVGMILRASAEDAEGKGRYVLESLRGFDLFPQTAHVESVAVLRLVDEEV
ncbi:tRNA methyltransferase [Mycena sp. CBHHK59/15]|nr:tRNA methyltransferase [Mycena sp. CBHHK59/15]